MKTKGTAPDPRLIVRMFVIVALGAACAGFLISLSFGYANHSPKPHDVQVEIVGPAVAAKHIRSGLDHGSPGGFDVVRAASAPAARDEILDQNAAGALVIPRTGTTTILTAAAAGLSQKQTVESALEASSRALGRPSVVRDLAPLPNADSSGLSVFVFQLGLLIASVLAGAGIFLVGRNRRIWYRVAAACGFAVLVAAADVFAQYVILGSLSAAPFATFGLAVFGAAALVLFIDACQGVFGLSGTALAALAFIFVGNAVNGGTTASGFLPDVYRQVGSWLPNQAIVSGIRSVVYFGGRNLGHTMLVLSLWTGVALILVAAVDALHMSEIRQTSATPDKVYAKSALVHLRNRRQRRRSPATGAEPVPHKA